MGRFVVSQAAAHELLPACRLLFADNAAEGVRERLLDAAEPTGLFVARVADRLCAAALVQALPGATGLAWPPRGESRAAEDAVTAAACDWLRTRGVKVCQAFAAAGEVADMAPLERAGFRRITQLVSMSRELVPSTPPARRADLSFESGSLAAGPLPPAFRPALLATQEGTLDCPELNASRTADELLAGFEATTNSEFYLASCGSECVGVLLSEYFAESGCAELSYLGVVPSARGRGIGGAILASALARLFDAGCREITLSVDVRNEPAMRLYARYGFAEDGRRDVWLAHLHNEPEA